MSQPTYTMKVHANSVSTVAFFKDGRRVVTGSWDRMVKIWDLENRKMVGKPLEFKGHSDYVYSVAISPDDKRIASGGQDGAINIWDVDKKQTIFRPLLRRMGQDWSVCFSPDGKRLARGHDETVIICDAKTGAVLSTLQGGGAVYCIAFSPDGLKLASGTERKIRVWSTDNPEHLFDIDAHGGWVHSVMWLPDGQQLVSASEDKTIKFWDPSNGTQIGLTCTGHTNDITSLAISSDGSFIATASDDTTVRLWSVKSHEQIGKPLEHTTYVNCVAISPSGELLASGDFHGNIQLWPIENTLLAAFKEDSSYFAGRSKVKLNQNHYAEALLDADKVIELNPSSHLGYELKYLALRGAHRHDDAFEAFTVMLSKLDDPQIRQQYVSQYNVESAIRQAIEAQLKKAPLRLINTSTGRVCNRSAQINGFMKSTEYEKLLTSLDMHGPPQTELIKDTVAKYFSWVMLSHRWGNKEPGLRDIEDGNIYDLDPVGTVVKLQKFCGVARDAGHRWAWSDTCCIDQNNNAELQESVNSMFVWYQDSALTIVYLSDVPPLSKSGALADSIWNTRGWTVQEFIAPKIILFYQADWTLYLDDRSCNHKQSVGIMNELERSTGINVQALVDFHPGTRDAREKLRWASNRNTTKEEDIAYSLFGIFDANLSVIYGEKKQKALGRLLQYIIAHSGDVTALDWVGKSSSFNSCLPADISSYKGPSNTLPSVSEHDMQTSVSMWGNHVGTVKLASRLHAFLLEKLGVPRFANARLQLPCITFPLTEVKRRPGQDGAGCFLYDVKADGLRDLVITTEDQLGEFSPARRTQQTFLLIHPWTRDLLEPPDFAHESQSVGDQPDEPFTRALGLLVRLSRPFSALLLVQQRGEYKRIASDNNIIAEVRDIAKDMMNVRTLEIL